MDSPALGFRRATIASWALVGVGVAGVAAATTLAYADTVKPPEEVPVDVAVPAPVALVPLPVQGPPPPIQDPPPPPPDVVTTTIEAPPPVAVATPEWTPEYTPEPTYVPETTVERAPAPEVTAPPTTTRRTHPPTTRMAPNYSPPHSVSRGS